MFDEKAQSQTEILLASEVTGLEYFLKGNKFGNKQDKTEEF